MNNFGKGAGGPAHLFVGPGEITITETAVKLAVGLRDEARKSVPGKDWVAGFDWADSRRIRRPGTNDWVDLGAGLDACVFERRQVPPDRILVVNGEEIVAKIGAHILSAAPIRTIDADPGHPGEVVLS